MGMNSDVMYEILAIDDDPHTLKLLQTLLVEEGYTIRLATNGFLAIRSIQSRLPDLILLDLNMLEMSGYEVCRRLKADPSTKGVPVIVVSGTQESVDKVKVFALGAVDFLTKPFQADELKARIRIHLNIRNLQQELRHFNQELENLVQERTKTLALTNEELSREIQVRRHAEESLAQEKAFTNHIVERAPTLICGVAPDGICTYINPAVTEATGFSEEEVLGRNWWRLVYPGKDYEQVERLFEDFEKEGFNVRNYEMDLLTKTGSKQTISWNFVNRLDAEGNLREVIGIGMDVTDRKHAAERLQDANDRLRELSRQLERAKEAERKRIARELHDEFGQSLSSLKWDLASLRRDLQGESTLKNSDKLRVRLEDMSNLLSQTIHATRRIATSLRPPMLDDLGLVPALEWQASDFQQRTGVPCAVSLDSTFVGESFNSDQATALFRISQELLTNILRHAQASQIHIRLQKQDGLFHLEVQDNGIGFIEPPPSTTGSLGLLGIQERAKTLGGHFSIRGVPGSGTVAVVQIPI